MNVYIKKRISQNITTDISALFCFFLSSIQTFVIIYLGPSLPAADVMNMYIFSYKKFFVSILFNNLPALHDTHYKRNVLYEGNDNTIEEEACSK